MSIEIGGALIGAPRNTGPSVRVRRDGTRFYVISTPHPVHWAKVHRMPVGGWVVSVQTADVTLKRYPSGELNKALQHAARLVGGLYRVDMRARFTGPQRFVMGRNLCPERIACPDPSTCDRMVNQGDRHYHLCKKAPDTGDTIWCPEHTDYPAVPGDAFRSLDESSGGD